MLNIIHIISSLDRINFGIWNAALFGSVYLQQYDVNSVAWICSEKIDLPPDLSVTKIRFLGRKPSTHKLTELVISDLLMPANTIFVSHGCWLGPTRIGLAIKRQGFQWIYTPHGMLEPWSMQQGRLKKLIYYYLYERRAGRNADAIRAVSRSERNNLKQLLKREVHLVENGVVVGVLKPKESVMETFVFMGRLHEKKGVVPLVRAWKRSMLHQQNRRLVIAGPDDGELEKIFSDLGGNIEYEGPVYGLDKIRLLETGHYFLLPSYSEGFPTSVIEAMSFGMIPLISAGCNFPEVFEKSLGYRVEPDQESISNVFDKLINLKFDQNLSRKNHDFVNENYSDQKIGMDLYELYRSVNASI